jgi:hypothetical protein
VEFMKTFETIERGAYVVIGAADLATEKVREASGIQRLRETSLVDQIRDIEPTVRRNATELSNRGEKVVSKLVARAEEARKSVESLPTEARKALEGLREDAKKFRQNPKGQLDQIRTAVTERVGLLRTRNGSTAGKNKAA